MCIRSYPINFLVRVHDVHAYYLKPDDYDFLKYKNAFMSPPYVSKNDIFAFYIRIMLFWELFMNNASARRQWLVVARTEIWKTIEMNS